MLDQPSYWKVLTRRKQLEAEGTENVTKLNRVLGLCDLTLLGVGSTLGAGVYVLAGQIARDQAGPSVMLSFAIAALASLLAGVCYAEFGARVPKAGSAYIYSYVCIGEFAAFIIGWNLILEYMIGTAAVCRGISVYLDTLINDTLKNTFAEVAPMEVSFLASYFDFFAFGLVIVFGVALAFGVETSTLANNFCTCLNICILLFVIIAGSIKANFDNWTINVNDIPTNSTTGNVGSGGYFPFGFEGTLKGAATCFFGFVGFDCIATTGEEVRSPRKNIPRAFMLSLLLIFLCYFGVSTVLTLMVPYYLQDPNAPLPNAFKEVGWDFAMWIVAVGGLIGLLASLFGALFPLPRVMYSMAEDGLLFRTLGKVSTRYRVPVVGSILAAMVTALIAGLFDLAQLVNLLSIGTLLAYSVVAISITILRYMDNDFASDRENGNQPLTENSMLTSTGTRLPFKAVLIQFFNFKRLQTPNALSTRVVVCLITVFCLLSLGIGLIFMQAYDALISDELWVLILLCILVALAILALLAICVQPQEICAQSFRVPFVPILPGISIFINIYLMLQLDVMTWIRFGIWMAIGIPLFIACWCTNNVRNPLKRNLRRLSFAKALKACAIEEKKPLNGHIKENGESINSSTIGSNGTTLSIKNENSVKSLDEILTMDEVGADLIEMKHANGNKFYVEDTKSNNSNTSIHADVDPHSTAAAATSEACVDDEKSVIAMLDDMLQAEEDNGLPTPNILGYDRKISIDSQMFPSVIETTTVATVHSSSDSSEKDLGELTEMEAEHDNLSADYDMYAESKRIANSIVDDVLNSTQLWNAIERYITAGSQAVTPNPHSNDQRPDENAPSALSKSPNDITDKDVSLRRTNSEASILSNYAVDNPLHSDAFKNKLSQIFMRPQTPVTLNTKPKDEKLVHNEDSKPSPPQLKHSKSETDLRKLLLNAIEDTAVRNASEKENFSTAVRTKDGDVGIPKAPKFDPVLYQTLNSLNTKRQRPGLERLLKHDENPIIPSKTKNLAQDDEHDVPFREKLEAILIRGPSHRTQQRPDVPIRAAKSIGPSVRLTALVSPDDDSEEERSVSKATKSNSNLSPTTQNTLEAIIDVKKLLKPVKNDPV